MFNWIHIVPLQADTTQFLKYILRYFQQQVKLTSF